MASSFEKINYNLRPNKCIERKMMSEALARLTFIDRLENYRYIGFGSPYFADFILFHKILGITDLISVEKEIDKKKRFDFNIPYSGIEMKYGHSKTILPNLELGKRKNILWLDYDDKVSDFMFTDIHSFFSEASPGSFFIISVNVEEEFINSFQSEENGFTLPEFRMKQLIDRIGQERLPNEYNTVNMNTKNLTKVTYEMIVRAIDSSLLNRNGIKENPIKFEQIFNFTYKDNAAILTVGGILFEKKQLSRIKKMEFERLPFYVNNSESYKIQCPNLTFREIKALDKALPGSLETIKGKFVNKKFHEIPLIPTDIRNYASVYRYYPNFTETNI